MKMVTLDGVVTWAPITRKTRHGQLMCTFLLSASSPLGVTEDADELSGITTYSVACWGDLAAESLALRCDDHVLIHGRVSGFRHSGAGTRSPADTLAVDAVALGWSLLRNQPISRTRDEKSLAREARRAAAMAAHPAGRGRGTR